MMEFFRNCGAWFVQNQGLLITIGTSSGFLALVAAVINLFNSKRNKASSKKTEEAANSIGESQSTITETNARVSSISENIISIIKSLTDNSERTSKMVDELKVYSDSKFDVLDKKLNTMIDVQSIVYSTIKDDTVRRTVENLLTSAKFAEARDKEELLSKISDMKKIVDEQTLIIKQLTEEKAKAIIKEVAPETIEPSVEKSNTGDIVIRC